ncbi:gliding motility lipoprotein GldB [Flavobacterium orientale]|uniref:Gliding motility lipoprotein GldB n=1 Tax=Flavobacterium orientale TaxID=1756020 RepID=A0A917D814_9FLAO|nr:gliding motility lipoprotein GldB [Flavobacterium orientale]
MFLFSCNEKSSLPKEIEELSVDLNIVRFDKFLYETPISEFKTMRSEYSVFFPEEIADSVFINKIQDPLYRELYEEVQKKYSDFTPVQNEIEDLYRHIKFYFPDFKMPSTITTLISEMEYQNKVILTDSLMILSLDLYLGKDHKYYVGEFPGYFCQTFERSQILPDIVTEFNTKVTTPARDRMFISQMIYYGKELYLKDILLPDYADYDKIGYTKEQLEWCEANENEMWLNFIQESYLYSTDLKLVHRFIAPAPFSKFYLDIDNESTGRVGVWLGWQIVRSYMKNNNVSLQQLLAMDARELFELSRYKPKK